MRVVRFTINTTVSSIANELSIDKHDVATDCFTTGYQGADADADALLSEEAVRSALRQVAPYNEVHIAGVKALFAEVAESERRWGNAQLRQVVEGLLRETIEAADAAAVAAPVEAAGGGPSQQAQQAAEEDAALADSTAALLRGHLQPALDDGVSPFAKALARQVDNVHGAAKWELQMLVTGAQKGQAAPEVVAKRLEAYGLGKEALATNAGAAYLGRLLSSYSTTNNLLRAIVDPVLRAFGTFAARNTGLAEMDEVNAYVLDVLRELDMEPAVLLLAKPATDVDAAEEAARTDLKARWAHQHARRSASHSIVSCNGVRKRPAACWLACRLVSNERPPAFPLLFLQRRYPRTFQLARRLWAIVASHLGNAVLSLVELTLADLEEGLLGGAALSFEGFYSLCAVRAVVPCRRRPFQRASSLARCQPQPAQPCSSSRHVMLAAVTEAITRRPLTQRLCPFSPPRPPTCAGRQSPLQSPALRRDRRPRPGVLRLLHRVVPKGHGRLPCPAEGERGGERGEADGGAARSRRRRRWRRRRRALPAWGAGRRRGAGSNA